MSLPESHWYMPHYYKDLYTSCEVRYCVVFIILLILFLLITFNMLMLTLLFALLIYIIIFWRWHVNVKIYIYNVVSSWQTLLFCNVSISLFNEIQDYYIICIKLVYFYLHKHFWHIQIRVIFLCAICLCYFNLCICRVMIWFIDKK
jgi:hypothetical protein